MVSVRFPERREVLSLVVVSSAAMTSLYKLLRIPHLPPNIRVCVFRQLWGFVIICFAHVAVRVTGARAAPVVSVPSTARISFSCRTINPVHPHSLARVGSTRAVCFSVFFPVTIATVPVFVDPFQPRSRSCRCEKVAALGGAETPLRWDEWFGSTLR